MKKNLFLITCLTTLFAFTSCKDSKTQNNPFLGTWGVEKMEYWQTDFGGHEMDGTHYEYHFEVPGAPNDGISMVFKADKSGEIQDRSIDTFWYHWDPVAQAYLDYIVRPDTVLVSHFNYSYDSDAATLYLTMENTSVFSLQVNELNDNRFVYTNKYGLDQQEGIYYYEKAQLKRTNSTTKVNEKKGNSWMPRHDGSLLSN